MALLHAIAHQYHTFLLFAHHRQYSILVYAFSTIKLFPTVNCTFPILPFSNSFFLFFPSFPCWRSCKLSRDGPALSYYALRSSAVQHTLSRAGACGSPLTFSRRYASRSLPLRPCVRPCVRPRVRRSVRTERAAPSALAAAACCP
jgi:hypothetical protein